MNDATHAPPLLHDAHVREWEAVRHVLPFLRAGFGLVEIPLGAKAPRRQAWQRREAAVFGTENAHHFENANAGILHEWSRTCAIDIDDYDAADAWLTSRGINLEQLFCADAAVSISSGRPNRGKLLYRLPDEVEPPPTIKIKADDERVILEFRCAGSQDVVAGKHPSGTAYTVNGDPAAMPMLPGTLWELWRAQIARPKVAAEKRVNTGSRIASGGRNEALIREAGRLRHMGYSAETISAALQQINAERCDPPLERAEVETIARSAGRYAPGNGQAEGEFSDPPPVDLLRPMAAPPLRVADVPDVLAHFAEAHARATGFDVSIMLAGGIGAACGMLSDEVRLCVASQSSWFESARLWPAIVGGPGSGKTPGLRAVCAPLFALHRELIAEWSSMHAKDDGDDMPPMPALYTSDATTEALSDLLRDNERGILYLVDELESWLASHDAYRSSGAGKDRGEWLRLYDGGPHHVNRVKRGAFFIRNWGCSLLAATTPAALRKMAPKLPDDGLMQRLLLVLARPRELPDAAMLRVETRQPAEAWDAALRRLYALPSAVVHLSAAAREIFEAEQANLHRLTQAFEDLHPPYAAHLAKRPAMVARLALVFHALEVPAIADNLTDHAMRLAVRFMRRQERHAQAIYGSLLGADTGMALAKAIARSILASGLQSFNRRELMHRCKAFRGPDDTRRAALSLLCDCAWLTTDAATVTHGTHWTVDPRVHSLFAEHGEAARKQREAIRERITAAEDDDE
jgi:hypothetical protein